MRHRLRFTGIAIHPRRVSAVTRSRVMSFGQSVLMADTVGVWLGRAITSRQRERLLGLGLAYAPGHIGVRIDRRIGITVVQYLGRLKNQAAARAIAVQLMRSVKQVVGAQTILLRLPKGSCLDYRTISRALAPVH